MSYIRKIILSVRIENWSTGICDRNPFLSPELSGLHLRGQVYGHASKEDGSWVKTSRIQSVQCRIIETLNTTYELGEPDPEFVKWMQDEHISFDPDEPIKIIKSSR